jgi:histidinol-phosphatase (PHP family)
MLMDYHLHSSFSGDGHNSMAEICAAAQGKGLTHIALTDHHDIGNPKYEMADLGSYVREIDRCRSLFPNLDIARGMEMDYRPETWERMKGIPASLGLDFALLSLHFVGGVDPYLPEYFDGKTQREGYAFYLERLAQMIRLTQGPWVLSHLTYVAKFARFEKTELLYADYADELDEVLRLAVAKGYGLEVNASGIKNNAGLLPGVDVLRRFRELGGETVTVGSDAHSAADAGRWIREATDAVKDAGFRYLASYRGLKSDYIKID